MSDWLNKKMLRFRIFAGKVFRLFRQGRISWELRYRVGEQVASAKIKARKLINRKNSEIEYTAAAAHDYRREGQLLDPTTEVLLHNSDIRCLLDAEYAVAYRLCDQLGADDPPIMPESEGHRRPGDWPDDLELASLPESLNDYKWFARRRSSQIVKKKAEALDGISVIIPTYNRSRLLGITLAALVNQTRRIGMEVIVVDDGSAEPIHEVVKCYSDYFPIKYLRQEDLGYRLCAARNLGLKNASYSYVAILDCDMAPGVGWLDSYVRELEHEDCLALIGPRVYVNTEQITPEEIIADPGTLERTPTGLSVKQAQQSPICAPTVDWRLPELRATDNLRLSNAPFRFFSGGNVCFKKDWVESIGGFDEDFQHWGGEDNEFGYRLFRAGCLFKSVPGALAYHQEPPGKENETDREAGRQETSRILADRVPILYRRPAPLAVAKLRVRPLVSIYIPAFNAEETVIRAVYSALNQTIHDLEVCVCDDGSTDQTRRLIDKYFKGNPRVHVVSRPNGGIGAASNVALRMCQGHFIGQLDSDDYLEPKAVELCLKEFNKDAALVCVYTSNRNVWPNNGAENGYNWPVYNREKFATSMICHHFRMFTARAWYLTEGFSEDLTNAVDYDMFLKLSEVGKFKHVNAICYNRVVHGANTSITCLAEQKENHFEAANKSLARQNIGDWRLVPMNPNDPACRAYRWVRNRGSEV